MDASQTQLQLGEIGREHRPLHWCLTPRRALSMHEVPLRVRFFEGQVPGSAGAGAFHAVATAGRWSAQVKHVARGMALAAGNDWHRFGDHALHVDFLNQ